MKLSIDFQKPYTFGKTKKSLILSEYTIEHTNPATNSISDYIIYIYIYFLS